MYGQGLTGIQRNKFEHITLRSTHHVTRFQVN